MTTADTKVYKTYMCLICGFIYDEAAGIPEEGIAPVNLTVTWPLTRYAARARKTSRWWKSSVEYSLLTV